MSTTRDTVLSCSSSFRGLDVDRVTQSAIFLGHSPLRHEDASATSHLPEPSHLSALTRGFVTMRVVSGSSAPDGRVAVTRPTTSSSELTAPAGSRCSLTSSTVPRRPCTNQPAFFQVADRHHHRLTSGRIDVRAAAAAQRRRLQVVGPPVPFPSADANWECRDHEWTLRASPSGVAVADSPHVITTRSRTGEAAF